MRRFSFLTLLASLLIVGCTEVTIEQSNPLTEINSLPDLTASFADEGETRTFVEDSKYLRWHESDLITAFFGNTLNRQYKFKGKTGDNSGTFSLVPSGELGTGNDLSSIYAVYPYDENTTITDNGVISLTLPATQTYAENSFGKGANTMVAVTESVEDTFLSFKNACGYLKLKLYGNNVTIASIEIKGNNEEKIAGSATATMEFGGVPTIAMNDEATTSVTLDCGEGVSIGATADMATEFWIVMPETTFEGGITITATNTDGAVFSKSTTNTVAITRNDIQPMVALKAEFATAKPANNEIWYTNGSTTEATTPYKTDVFGANIVSNTYDADKECWVIKFDGEVTTIGMPAFLDCTTLKSIIIPNSVLSIGNSAFRRCSNLVEIVLPASITAIGSDLFAGCTSLSNVTLPNNLISIGVRAFSNCTSLKNITIPDSVKTIDNEAFRSCSQLSTISIPNSVTVIGDSVFADCTSLTDATISDSVSSMGGYVFSGCSSLINVTLSNNLSFLSGRTFLNCSSLATITIPDSVTTIYHYAFSGCSNLMSVNICNSVTTIGNYAFNECSSLTSITIPDSVTTIGNYAFYRCSDLLDVVIGNGVITIGDYAFRECNSLSNIILGNSVQTIGEFAFYECYKLKSLIFPKSVTTIKEMAFGHCTGVESINFDNSRTSIDTFAFTGCTRLTNVCFGNSITNIGTEAFSGCTMLRSISIPDSVNTIGVGAFYACSNLKEFIGKYSSDDNRCLVIDGNLIAFAPAELTEYIIPETIISIEAGAFAFCQNLKNITIPNSVSTIGVRAFNYCIGLTSITIPDSVSSIGLGAFYGCTSLKDVYCKPVAPPTIDDYLFNGHASEFKIYVPTNSVNSYISDSLWSDYSAYIVGYNF